MLIKAEQEHVQPHGGADSFAHRRDYRSLYLIRFGKALAGILGTYLIWKLAVTTEPGQLVDNFMMIALGAWSGRLGGIDEIILWLVGEIMIISVGVLSLLIVGWRRRWRLGWRALGALILTVVTVRVLKIHLLYRPDLGVTYELPNSLPSGHTAIAVAVAVALVMAVAPRWRPTFALIGGAWVSLVGISTIINGWHRPSDVLAAILVAGTYAMILTPIETEAPIFRHDLNRLLMRGLGWGGWMLLAVGTLSTLVLTWRVGLAVPAVTTPHLVEFMKNYAVSSTIDRSLSQIAVLSLVSGLCLLMLRAIAKLVR